MTTVETKNVSSYFCTVGSGMEQFCVKELNSIKGTEILEVICGKVFFKASCSAQTLLALKSVERLFIMVCHCKQFLHMATKKVAFDNLRKLLEKDIDWLACLNQWAAFTHLKKSNDMELENIKDKSFELNKISRNAALLNSLEDNTIHPQDDESNVEPPTKKTCLDGNKNFPELTSSSSQNDTVAAFQTIEAASAPKNCNAMELSLESCLDENTYSPKFRVSCKCTGAIRGRFHSVNLAQFIGCSLSKICSWKVDLRNPELDVNVHANYDYLTIGLTLTRKPLSERTYLKHIALRSTICHAMLTCLEELPDGSILLDPMCGAGTIITEAAVNYPNLTVLGVDVDVAQLNKAQENAEKANCISRMDIIHGDVTYLAIKNESVNSIICDFPFGQKFGSPKAVEQLLPRALKEMDRVLNIGGKIALLINKEMLQYLLECVMKLNKSSKALTATELQQTENTNTSTEWKNLNDYTVKLGETVAVISVFGKNLAL